MWEESRPNGSISRELERSKTTCATVMMFRTALGRDFKIQNLISLFQSLIWKSIIIPVTHALKFMPFYTTNGLIWKFEASWFLSQTMFYTLNDLFFVCLFFLQIFFLFLGYQFFDNKNLMLFTFIVYSFPSQRVLINIHYWTYICY